MTATNSPGMEFWAQECEDKQCHWWTMDCQGITSYGESLWAVNANNNKPPIEIYKFNFGFGDPVKTASSPCGTDHLGPPDYFENKIYVPVEGAIARVWTLDTDLNTLGLGSLQGPTIGDKPPQGAKMPWCAINPWNGLLYSSKFGEPPYWEEDPSGSGRWVDWDPVTEVHCYDPADNFTYKKSLTLAGEPLHKVQGGCFSTNGHLNLSSDYTRDIRGYSAINGSYLGSFAVPSDWSGGEEMEGVSICPVKCPGKYTPISVLVQDGDWPSDSDIYFKHIAVPWPEFL
jgi:hypothetical protein